jgi:hypothetical protein
MGGAESIEWFKEDQTLSPLYDLAPPPSLPLPLPSASCLSFSFFLCVAGRAYWRGGGGTKSYDSEEAWSSINHSVLSGWQAVVLGHSLISILWFRLLAPHFSIQNMYNVQQLLGSLTFKIHWWVLKVLIKSSLGGFTVYRHNCCSKWLQIIFF